LATACFAQQKIFEDESTFPRGKWIAADLAGGLSTGPVLRCVDFDYLIKGVAGWTSER
jgi:hypothetical protein